MQSDGTFPEFWRPPTDPAAPALMHRDGTTSHEQLSLRADHWQNRLGKARRLVFLQVDHTPDAVAIYLACLRGGHVVHLFKDYEPDRMQALMTAYRPNIIFHAEPGEYALEPVGEHLHALHSDLRVLLSTSGSTGTPKFVKLSARNLASNAASIAQYLELTPGDRAASPLNFSYSYGLSVINSALLTGSSVIIPDVPAALPEFWDLAKRHGATSFSGVPYHFQMLEHTNRLADLPELRYVTQAGGKLAPELVRHFAAMGRRLGWRFYVMYGQTEASPRISYVPPERVEQSPDSIGLAIPGGELGLIDETGRPITEQAATGELVYAGPNVMMGYAHDQQDLGRDDGLRRLATGDIARRDVDGLYSIVGRKARFIKPYGIRVNLDDVEATCTQVWPDCIVSGTDERITIGVVRPVAPPTSESSDLAAIAGKFQLPPDKFRIISINEIPRLSNGKINYKLLDEISPPAPQNNKIKFRHNNGSGTYIGPLTQYAAELFGNFTTELKKNILPPESWQSALAIFREVVDARATPGDSFVSLHGNSLSYIETLLALEEYLGEAPDHWETLTISDLEALHRDISAI